MGQYKQVNKNKTNISVNIDNNIRHNWTSEEILQLFKEPLLNVVFRAASLHRKYFDPNKIQVSSLLSIKTGSCPEDCKYCPQSAHYNTSLQKEPLLETKKVVAAAIAAKKAGATRFCMGAAWRELKDKDLPLITDMITKVKDMGLETCVTLGMANANQLKCLKESGLDYYNHNIDTSPEYYGNIITTRNFNDRMETIANIAEAGLKTCCGGIVGMGETEQDRASMLVTLANLPNHPESVPINLLVKVEGTPLATNQNIDPFDFLRMVAITRIVMPKSYVRLSAGRESMSNEMQAFCFLAGANSIFYGEKLLTTPNPSTNHDINLFNKLSISIM